MRAVIQRVKTARVKVEGEVISEIGPGMLVLLGVRKGDGLEEVRYMAEKIAGLRIFDDDQGKMNRSLLELGGETMVVSQFTLYGDVRKGKRPSFDQAERPARAEELYQAFIKELQLRGIRVKSGRFGARMEIEMVGDGPVTILVEFEKKEGG